MAEGKLGQGEKDIRLGYVTVSQCRILRLSAALITITKPSLRKS